MDPREGGYAGAPVSTLATEAAPRIEAEATLPLVRELAGALDRDGITYCHWKGTYSLEGVARGEKDLDLLVKRADYGRFLKILGDLGFKEARSRGSAPLGVHHYYGYDGESGRLVHVHSQSALVVGTAASGIYRIPIEEPYLAAATPGRPFRIPQPELELVVFVIRMALWQSPISVLRSLRSGTVIPTRRREELAYLKERADADAVLRSLRQHLPSLDPDLFQACLETLESRGDPWKRARCWWRLLGAVHPWRHRSRVGQLGSIVWHGGARALGRLSGPRSSRKRLAAGGAIIAFVGGDGAGKSTAIDSLSSWLGEELATDRVHLGKPRRSWTTWAVRGALKGFRALVGVVGRRAWNEAEWRATSTSYSALVWHVCRARDRYRLFRSARRAAIEGNIVLCDRFPLTRPLPVDGPRVDRLLESDIPRSRLGAGIRRLLASLENRYYGNVAAPDLLFVLRLHPDLAAERKPEEGREWVRRRARAIWEADWSQIRAEVLDASRPVQEVHATMRALTWSRL